MNRNGDAPNYTPLEQQIMKLLGDGLPHKPEELMQFFDPLAERQSMYNVVCSLRKKLKPLGEDIVAQKIGWGVVYRRVRLLIVSTDDT